MKIMWFCCQVRCSNKWSCLLSKANIINTSLGTFPCRSGNLPFPCNVASSGSWERMLWYSGNGVLWNQGMTPPHPILLPVISEGTETIFLNPFGDRLGWDGGCGEPVSQWKKMKPIKPSSILHRTFDPLSPLSLFPKFPKNKVVSQGPPVWR